MSQARCHIVIPARLASTRLPEKLLRRAGGKSVLHHTYDAAMRSQRCDGVVVAVDAPQMAEEVESFGGRWIMTSVDHTSGTDRIAEVARQMPEVDVFVNVQGDEPEISPATIDSVAGLLMDDPSADMATAGTPIRSLDQLSTPNCVKIVMGGYRADSDLLPGGAGRGRAVYFSRAAVPFVRDCDPADRIHDEPPIYWHHLGLYAYRREFLGWFESQPASLLETTEKLEQLRAIEAGKKILVTRVPSATAGIDTAADLEAFAARLAAR
ncbi:3-deoxy-manno-octulosonate cytidylyltransferase [Rubripirellula lacrimiformis]|uniref:3-deoxy-manno-octulosonate cytidylyltransferase n=1 Tax=Rubripirellula lacrimiformis TaxID=1930273 RepID=A0A517N669_9BACT|nr:3-deoxy-manno-octulosonate cytidylyltransferase [Rubripirellula lacrimiformis]QDT02627.1 3-deoxy-manno-octulosonate cytidylyltransferase [Rubripirellula lacrimiformis]